MARRNVIPEIEITAGNSAEPMWRGTFNLGGVETQIKNANVASASYRVYDGAAQLAEVAVSPVSSIISDTYQTGTIWKKDATGYNVKLLVAGSYFTKRNNTYWVVLTLNLVGGQVAVLTAKVKTVNLPI